MKAPSTPLWQPLSTFLARLIVRFWPADTKRWGLAFEAELSEITTPFASFRWLIGGFMLLTNESLRYFIKSLKRPLDVPAGGVSSSFLGDSGPTPRLPRVFVAVFLLLSFAMLCLPEVRASLASTIISSETGVQWFIHERNVQKLREKARANHDPQLLAFLSLVLHYDQERFELADEAIRRDPSLTWIDYVESYWNYADPDRHHYLSDERIGRLQKFDPQNAVPLLLSAEAIRHPIELASLSSETYKLGKVPAWEHEVAKNGAWLDAMDHAFAAPEFHSYEAQQVDLVREISNRYHLTDPDFAYHALLTQRLPGNEDIEAYSRWLIERGDEAARKGNVTVAAQEYEKVERFAEEIRDGDGGEFDIAHWFSAKIGSKAGEKLQAIFETAGRPAEAQIAAAKLAGWNDISLKLRSQWQRNACLDTSPKPWSKTERAGLFINLSALFIAFLLPIAVVVVIAVGFAASLARQIFGKFYRFVCVAVDGAPILLLGSFTLLFFAYHPYANPYKGAVTREDIFAATVVAHSLPRTIGRYVFDFFNLGYYFWIACTAALSALALFLIYRMLPKRRSS